MRTLTAGDAIRIVSTRFPRLDTSGLAARFADEIQAIMWHRYAWRESLAELPPFHLVYEEPDYGPPLLAVPADFYGLHGVHVRNTYITYPSLTVVPNLPISTGIGIPDTIAYQAEKKAFRVHPRPSVRAPEWWIEGSYKKTPTKITNANLNSYILPFDDLYFEIFRRGLVWKVKEEILGDEKAFQDEIRFMNDTVRMAAAEGLHSGVILIAPAEGLELGG